MTEIRTIVFDLGGVLIDYDLERCFNSFRALGFSNPEDSINPYKQSGMFLKLEDGTAEEGELYRYIDRQVGHRIDPRRVDEAWCSFLLDIPAYKLDMLLYLRRKGYQLFMLSNTNQIMFDWMRRETFTVQGLTVEDYFDRLFLSYEMKLVKPGAEIFREMASQGGIDPRETLLIDDGAANVATARSLGFHVYQPEAREDFRELFAGYSLKS